MLSGLREGGRSGSSAATICVIWRTGVVVAVVGVESGEESFFGSLTRHPEIATHYSRNTKQSATLIRLSTGLGAFAPAVGFSAVLVATRTNVDLRLRSSTQRIICLYCYLNPN